MRTNELYIPAPTRKAAAFTVHTPRIRIIVHVDQRLGRALLVDDPRDEQDHARPTNSPTVRGSPQPQVEPSLMATSRQTSHAGQQRARRAS